MQALFRLLFEACNLLFFDFFLCFFLSLASEVLDFEPMWLAPRYLAKSWVGGWGWGATLFLT